MTLVPVALFALVAAADPVTILVLDPESDDRAFSSSFSACVAKELATDPRAKVFSADDVNKLVSLASNLQATGCDSSSCLSEVADALGARFVVFGTVAKLGDERQVDLRLFDVAASSIASREHGAAHSRAEALALAPVLTRRLVTAPLPPPALFTRPLFVTGFSVAVAGVVASASFGSALYWANAVAGDARSPGADKTTARSAAPLLLGGIVVGGTALLGGSLAALAIALDE